MDDLRNQVEDWKQKYLSEKKEHDVVKSRYSRLKIEIDKDLKAN